MSTNAAVVNTGNEAMPTSYPDLDATSPTDSVIAGDFGTLSAAEQVCIWIYTIAVYTKKALKLNDCLDFYYSCFLGEAKRWVEKWAEQDGRRNSDTKTGACFKGSSRRRLKAEARNNSMEGILWGYGSRS